MDEHRLPESQQKTEQRRKKNALRASYRRTQETTEQTVERRRKDNARAAQRRKGESHEETKIRRYVVWLINLKEMNAFVCASCLLCDYMNIFMYAQDEEYGTRLVSSHEWDVPTKGWKAQKGLRTGRSKTRTGNGRANQN